MHTKESIMSELWERISNVEGVLTTTRNPSAPPTIDDFPIIQIFELEDAITSVDGRGGYPIFKRSFTIVIETYLTSTTETLASKELQLFIAKLKKEIYRGGNNLNKKCVMIMEEDTSKVWRPPIGNNSIGISIQFKVIYIEDISKLY